MADTASEGSFATLLDDLSSGRDGAFRDLIDAVYADLRAMAGRRLGERFGERARQLTLQPTMLANDVAMRLLEQRQSFENREHFFAIATRLMLRLIIDYQRERMALKRGGGRVRASESVIADIPDRVERVAEDDSVVALAGAIEQLHNHNPRQAEVVTLHLYCEMPLPRVADLVGVSLPTVERDWRFAKAWLRMRVAGSG